MKILLKKTCIKDIKKLPSEIRKKIEKIIFTKFPIIENLSEITSIKKIKGYKEYYRICIADYRLGFKYSTDTVTFMRVLHRKDIYKFFP